MDLTYDAFVSYSRDDKAFVERLIKRLERFAPPKVLGLPARRLRVFVDTKDLVGTSYYEAVERALSGARKLIVICSPSSRRSPYVEDEIRRFLKVPGRTGQDIIPILLEGIPNNEARSPEEEANKAFPEVLYEYMEMPLAVDYLRFDLRRSKLDDGAYANSWFVLLANILEVKRDELEEREAKRRRQRRLTIGAITGTVIFALTVLSIVALWQREQAIDQRQKAYARQLAAQAQLGLADTIAPPQQALKQAMASLQLFSSREAIEALKTGVERLPPTHVSRLAMDEKDAMPNDLSFSPNGEWVVGASDNDIRVWHASDGARVFREAVDAQMALRGFTADGCHALYLPRKQDGKQDPASPTSPLLVLEIKGHGGGGFELRSHRFERILDAIVAGHGLFTLVSDGTGKRISVHDLLREETIGTLELPKAVVLGALDGKTGDSVIVDAGGKVRRLGYGLDTVKAEFKLPTGARALAIALMGGTPGTVQGLLGMPMMFGGSTAPDRNVLITQRPNKGLTILSLASGKAIRELDPEQARDFRGFVAAGTLLAATGTQPGVSLFTLDGQLVTTLVQSRAKDWDLNQMGVTGRQDPIIDVGASDDAQTVVTARKDGRISVWRPSLRPRYGTWGALPMADMESIAHFDHGAELGETVTWAGPPVLSVSSNGQYVASQSMGLEANPVGGIKSANPLLRIWDVRHLKEIGRFYPPGGMAVKFAPSGELLLTASVPRKAADRSKTDPRAFQIDIWKLSPDLFMKLYQRDVSRRSTPIPFVGSKQVMPIPPVALTPTGQRAVWVGSDLKLRSWEAASGEVAIIDELAPVIERVLTAQLALSRRRSMEHKDLNLPDVRDVPPVAELIASWQMPKGVPAELPIIMPITISGNGCCALLAIGTTLRVYELSSKRLLTERGIDDFVGPTGESGIISMLLSENGKFFVVTGWNWRQQYQSMQQKSTEALESGNMRLRVYSTAAKDPLRTIAFVVLPSSGFTLLIIPPSIVPLAIDPTGRWLAVDKLDFKIGPQFKPDPTRGIPRALTLFDLQDGKTQLELFSEPWWPPDLMDSGELWKTRSAVFSADGRFIAMRQTEPECRSLTSVAPMVMMPMKVPSCPGIKLTYTVWDLLTRQQSAKLEDLVAAAEIGSPASSMIMPAPTGSNPAPSPWTARTNPEKAPDGGDKSAGSSAAQPGAGTAAGVEAPSRHPKESAATDNSPKAEHVTQLSQLLGLMPAMSQFLETANRFGLDDAGAMLVTQGELDTTSGTMTLVTRRLRSSADSMVAEACARLEPEHRAFSPAQWASQFPGASFHPICASTGAHR